MLCISRKYHNTVPYFDCSLHLLSPPLHSWPPQLKPGHLLCSQQCFVAYTLTMTLHLHCTSIWIGCSMWLLKTQTYGYHIILHHSIILKFWPSCTICAWSYLLCSTDSPCILCVTVELPTDYLCLIVTSIRVAGLQRSTCYAVIVKLDQPLARTNAIL